jgi:hypothetical protein
VGVAALVLGILATVSSLTGFLFFIGVPLGIVGLILGIVARKNAVQNNQPTGMATAGLVLGIIGLALGVLMWILCAGIFAASKKMADEVAKDPAFRTQTNKEFNEAFKKAMEESAKQQQQQPNK